MQTTNNIKLCVGIMVKNEQEQIKCTLESIKGIKNLFIYDTGSTDNTIQVIYDFCKENDIELHLREGEFIDFSTSRNVLLSSIYASDCTHILLLDANDELIGLNNLIDLLTKFPNYELYETTQLWNDIIGEVKFKTFKVIKNIGKYFYKGVVHEVLNFTADLQYATLSDDVIIFQDRKKDDKSKSRYIRDAELLTIEHVKNPYDLRTIYYLANSYYFQDNYVMAKKYFKKRFKISIQVNEKPNEEIYQSILRIGKCILFIGKAGNSKYPTSSYWERVEKWSWKAWRYFHDIEPLIILISKYLELQDFHTTYYLASLACNTNTEPRLWKDEKKYSYDRYLALAISGIHTGHISEGYEALQKIYNSTYASSSKTIDFNKLFQEYEKELIKKYTRYSKKMTVLIFGGVAYRKWTSDSLETLGGSEYSAVKLAEELAKKNATVIISCDCDEKFIKNGVEYIRISDYHIFLKSYIVDQLIVLRFSDYLTYSINIGSVYLWLQDVTHIGQGIELNNKLKKIVVLSNWHKQKFLEVISKDNPNIISIIEPLITIIGNAIDMNRFDKIQSSISEKGKEKIVDNENIKKQMRFIYSSCPTRNLEEVVKIFSKIRKRYPYAELHIFSDFENSYAKTYFSEHNMNFKEEIQQIPGVFVNGRISQQELANEMMKSKYWLYLPTNFDETYCITALEMQCAHVIPITTSNGALEENISDRGFLLDSKIKASKILKIIESVENEEYLFDKMDSWTKEQTWNKRIYEWLQIFI